jgi:hypothetical protein
MNNSIEEIINHLNNSNVDGETMEHIIRSVGMEDQMLRQLVMKSDSKMLLELIEEKAELMKG